MDESWAGGGRDGRVLGPLSRVASTVNDLYYGSTSVIGASCSRPLKDRAIGYSASSLRTNLQALSLAELDRRIRSASVTPERRL
jgi:hypothetical protein